MDNLGNIIMKLSILIIYTLILCGCIENRPKTNSNRCNLEKCTNICKNGLHSISIICINDNEFYEVSKAKTHTLDELMMMRISKIELLEILDSNICNEIIIVAGYFIYTYENKYITDEIYSGLSFNEINDDITTKMFKSRNGDVKIWESYTNEKSIGIRRINR